MKRVKLFTGTAGVPPASSGNFTQAQVESVNSQDVAFNESGRDARGPSEELEFESGDGGRRMKSL